MWEIIYMFLSKKLTVSANLHKTLLCDSLYLSIAQKAFYTIHLHPFVYVLIHLGVPAWPT